MIKLCYIIGQLNKAGAEKQLYYLANSISKEKFTPVVVSLSQYGFWSEEIKKLNIQLIEIPRKKHKEFSRLLRLIKVLKTIKPQIIHTFLFPANTYGRIAGIITRIPIIISSERNLPEIGKDKKLWQICVDRILSFFTHGIICNSYKAANVLTKKYFLNRNKVFTIYNGIDGTIFFRNNAISGSKIAPSVIGTVGRLYRQKNYKLFLDMAKLILNMSGNRNIKFLIVGDGPLMNELKQYSHDLGIEKSVFFAGERTDITELLKGMDVFVMTSLYEGLSNAIMEAMAAGLPVVATDVGGNSELVINGETGFLCKLDARELAEKVNYLINNKEEARKMGEKGKKRIISEFSIEKMVRETENVYFMLLTRKLKKISKHLHS